MRIFISVWVSIAVLAGCSSSTELGSIKIEADSGGLLRTELASVALTPGALIEDQRISILASDSDLEGVVSKLITIEPTDTPLAQPVLIALSVADPQQRTYQLARVTDGDSLQLIEGTSVDLIASELRAQVNRFGSFVVVDTGSTAFQDSNSTNDYAFVGDWQGVGPYSGLSMQFEPNRFRLSRDGQIIREGSYEAKDGNIKLIDQNGDAEQGTYNFENAGVSLVINTMTAELRWEKIGGQPSASAATGFFHPPPVTQAQQYDTYPSPQQPPEIQSPDQYGFAVPPKNPPVAGQTSTAQSTYPPSSSQQADPLATQPISPPQENESTAEESAPKKKNFWQGLGSGVQKIGKATVKGVKNVGKGIGKQFKGSAEKAASDAQTTVEHNLDPDTHVAAAENYANAETNKALGQFQNKADELNQEFQSKLDPLAGKSQGGFQHPNIAPNPLLGNTPNTPAAGICLVSAAEVQQHLGLVVAPPRSLQNDRAGEQQRFTCQYMNMQGLGELEITFYRRTLGSVAESWNRDYTSGLYKFNRVGGLGDDARWKYIESGNPTLELGVLLGNSEFSLRWRGNTRYNRSPLSGDAPKLINLAKLSISRLQ